MGGGSTPASAGDAPRVARTRSADKKRPVTISPVVPQNYAPFAMPPKYDWWQVQMVATTVDPYAYAVNQGLVDCANKHARIIAACPILELHRPLAAAAACHAVLPPAHAGHAEVWSAVAKYLSQLRASFLMGHPPPQTPGYSFSPAMLRSALLEDVLAGHEGLLGRERQAVNGGANEGSGDGSFRSGKSQRGVRPYVDSLPRCPDAYVGFFRRGTFARCIKRALEGPAHALTAPVGRNVHTGGSAAVDFGPQRWVAGEDAPRMKDPTPAPSPHVHALAPNPFKRRAAAAAVDERRGGTGRAGGAGRAVGAVVAPLERWRTRHVEVTNDGDVAVLLLAVTAAPAQDAFRLRCDHQGLVRHPADDGPPIDDQPPIVLPPGATYELSVDLRCDEASAKVGSLSQWVLLAFVEMPEGWNGGERDAASGFDRGKSSRDGADDDPDGFDLMFDEKDVRVIGKRVGALVTGSRARTAELGALLDIDTPKFVPKRLREAFDSLPLLTVAPVTLIDADADEMHMTEVGATENDNDPQWVAIWERSQRNKATIEMRRTNRMAPAAYRGPRGVFLQRAFHCSNPWGEENGEQMYMHDTEWERVESSIEKRPMKRELARWIRLVRLEEAQQALDIRRYDAHNAVLKYAGSTRTVKARSVPMGVHKTRNTMDVTDHMPFDTFGRYDVDVYSLEVPGLIEGYPPVARNDVLRLRIVSVGTEEDNKVDSLPFDADVTEVAATVVRVITRTSTVYVAVPPLVTRVVHSTTTRGSRVAKGECLIREIRAHVRFAYDEALFRSQRAALEAASANGLVSGMLREVPEALEPGLEDPLIGAAFMAAAPATTMTTPMTMLDALNPEQRKVVTDVLDGTAAAVASGTTVTGGASGLRTACWVLRARERR